MTDHRALAEERLEIGRHIHSHELKMENLAIAQVEATFALIEAVKAQTEHSELTFSMAQDLSGINRTVAGS
jgi:hypothetical protein